MYGNDEYTAETVMSADGDYRVRVVRDIHDDSEPEHDCGYPVLRLDEPRERVDASGYGSESAANDGLLEDADVILTSLMARLDVDAALEVFDRWLRVFHGGSAKWVRGNRHEYGYITYGTAAMRESWGCTPSDELVEPEMDEWLSYVNGDVYFVIEEHRVYTEHVIDSIVGSDVERIPTDEWEEGDDIVHGFYGEEWAVQEAESWVRHYEKTWGDNVEGAA